MPEVRKFLVLHSTYLPYDLAGDILDAPITHGCVVMQDEYGFWLWVPNEPDDCTVGVPPPEVLRIQKYARSLDCDYVKFDCDGDTETMALPRFTEGWT